VTTTVDGRDPGVFAILADYGNPVHADALVRLLDMYARDPMGGGAGLSEHAKATLVPELAKRPQAFSVIGFVGDAGQSYGPQPVGLINCIEGFSTFACRPLVNVHDVAVDPAFRGRGVAPVMLEVALLEARRRGACKLTLEVLSNNGRALEVYEKFGFAAYQLGATAGQALFLQKWLD
jgi:ribosomal protein S18 acetylase RimI-like enzyme